MFAGVKQKKLKKKSSKKDVVEVAESATPPDIVGDGRRQLVLSFIGRSYLIPCYLQLKNQRSGARPPTGRT
jgi:hypothetical protein